MTELFAAMERLEIHCGLERCSSIYLPGETLDAAGLKMEAAARKECGLPSRWVDGAELKSRCPVEGEAAIVSGHSAKVDPVRFSLGFLSLAVARGVDVYRHVYVSDIQPNGAGIVASTKQGPIIAARFAVFATGYELPKYLSMPGKEIASTWVIATVAQTIAPSIHMSLVWEANDPYHYVRTTSAGRIIVGGEDEEFDDEEKRIALTPEKAKRLQKRLGELFPQLDTTIEYAWSGAFGRSETGLPSMGAIPGRPNCYAVVGFGGNGMTYAMIGAQLIERMLLGKADPDADLYAFE